MAHWVSPQTALEALAKAHDLSGKYANYEVCLEVAEETIMRRLALGAVPSISGGARLEGGDGAVVAWVKPNEVLPDEFWQGWREADPIFRTADWIAGDFHFSFDPQYRESPAGDAFGVQFDSEAMPWMASTGPSVRTPPNQTGSSGNEGASSARKPGAPVRYDQSAALTYLAALAHRSPDGLCDQDQSAPTARGIARILEHWVESAYGKNSGPSETWLRELAKQVMIEIERQGRQKPAGGTNSGN